MRIADQGTTVGALTLETTGKLTLRNGSSSVGATTAALTPGTIYRIGIHQKKGTGRTPSWKDSWQRAMLNSQPHSP